MASFSDPKALPVEIESTQDRPYDITRDGKQFLVMQRRWKRQQARRSRRKSILSSTGLRN
jgi:hypothetical protein